MIITCAQRGPTPPARARCFIAVRARGDRRWRLSSGDPANACSLLEEAHTSPTYEKRAELSFWRADWQGEKCPQR